MSAHPVSVCMSSLQENITALMKASNEGYYECVSLLLDKGAKVDHEDMVSTVLCNI